MENDADEVELITVSSGNCKGKLLIVHNPRQVILGTSENFSREPGLQLTDMVAKYNGLAGINAGGFNDENGQGDGGKQTKNRELINIIEEVEEQKAH